jgi:long-chain acyl-CoA synthetase
MYHSAPNVFASMALRAGGFVALQERFDAEQLLQWIERYRITHLHMVPTMFVRLLGLPESVRNRYDLSSLSFVVHAAAPCAPAVKQAMIEWWGPLIHEYYGGTETAGVTCCNSAEALERPGTVGRTLESCKVRILDANKKPLPAGEVGEIYMWHHGFPDFTYKNLEQARREMNHRGLVSLGDIGYLDTDGYLFICDRLRDMVISGGVNIYPAEIEGELQQMPGVKDCVVFGIPHPEFGESLCTHIEPDSNAGLTEEAVLSFLRVRLARYKVPSNVVFTKSLPREDTGKIFKRKIRDRYWENVQRAI